MEALRITYWASRFGHHVSDITYLTSHFRHLVLRSLHNPFCILHFAFCILHWDLSLRIGIPTSLISLITGHYEYYKHYEFCKKLEHTAQQRPTLSVCWRITSLTGPEFPHSRILAFTHSRIHAFPHFRKAPGTLEAYSYNI